MEGGVDCLPKDKLMGHKKVGSENNEEVNWAEEEGREEDGTTERRG